jgi:hypothetical protein
MIIVNFVPPHGFQTRARRAEGRTRSVECSHRAPGVRNHLTLPPRGLT